MGYGLWVMGYGLWVRVMGFGLGLWVRVTVKGVGVELGGLVQTPTLIRAGSMASLTVGPASSGS